MARRFHHHAGKMLSGGKQTIVGMGTGAAFGLLQTYAVSSIPWLSSNWWAMPVTVGLIGHFLKRKNPTVGGALLGIAGYWGITSWQASRTGTAKGFIDAGAFIDAGGPNMTRYNDSIGTDANPRLGMQNAGMLMDRSGTMGYENLGEQAGDIDVGEVMGLEN